MVDKDNMKQRMIDGKLYHFKYLPASDAKEWIEKFNNAPANDFQGRMNCLKNAFAEMGENCVVFPPMYADRGYNIHLGDAVFINREFLVLDQCPVKIGSHTFIGPRVSIYCAQHPIDAAVRITHTEYGKPVTIGENVWLGGSVTICPGVTIGDNTIIGAGAVVTKDIPANVIAAGNPCRIIREITEEDHEYWTKEFERFKEETGAEV